MGKKVENREERGTTEHRSAFWRKDKAEGWFCIEFKGLFFFFLKYCADVENCDSFKGFGFIYIFRERKR